MLLAAIDYESLIRDYGYWILLVGTFFEGETIVIIAGIMAKQMHVLNPWFIGLAAFAGSTAGDQVWFYLGRWRGPWLVERFPRLKPRLEKALGLLERHSNWLLLTYRFFYGLRNVTSIGAGMSRVSILKFTTLNAIGAIVWATVFTGGGYLIGAAFARFVEEFKWPAIGAVCAVIFAIWLIRLIRRMRKSKQALDAGMPTPHVDADPDGGA